MLKGYKTYIMGVLALVTALATYLVGDIDIATAGQLALTAVMGMTIRAGVSTETAKKLVIGALCVGMMMTVQPRQAEAGVPFFLFASTVITGGWGAATYEDCKVDGIELKECVKRAWKEREPLDYSKLNG